MYFNPWKKGAKLVDDFYDFFIVKLILDIQVMLEPEKRSNIGLVEGKRLQEQLTIFGIAVKIELGLCQSLLLCIVPAFFEGTNSILL